MAVRAEGPFGLHLLPAETVPAQMKPADPLENCSPCPTGPGERQTLPFPYPPITCPVLLSLSTWWTLVSGALPPPLWSLAGWHCRWERRSRGTRHQVGLHRPFLLQASVHTATGDGDRLFRASLKGGLL